MTNSYGNNVKKKKLHEKNEKTHLPPQEENYTKTFRPMYQI